MRTISRFASLLWYAACITLVGNIVVAEGGPTTPAGDDQPLQHEYLWDKDRVHLKQSGRCAFDITEAANDSVNERHFSNTDKLLAAKNSGRGCRYLYLTAQGSTATLFSEVEHPEQISMVINLRLAETSRGRLVLDELSARGVSTQSEMSLVNSLVVQWPSDFGFNLHTVGPTDIFSDFLELHAVLPAVKSDTVIRESGRLKIKYELAEQGVAYGGNLDYSGSHLPALAEAFVGVPNFGSITLRIPHSSDAKSFLEGRTAHNVKVISSGDLVLDEELAKSFRRFSVDLEGCLSLEVSALHKQSVVWVLGDCLAFDVPSGYSGNVGTINVAGSMIFGLDDMKSDRIEGALFLDKDAFICRHAKGEQSISCDDPLLTCKDMNASKSGSLRIWCD